jgi:hypothetical protein
MSENLADHGVLVPVAPPGAVPGSPDPDMIIPTAAVNAEAAMRTPGRRYRGGGAASSWREWLVDTFIAHASSVRSPSEYQGVIVVCWSITPVTSFNALASACGPSALSCST